MSKHIVVAECEVNFVFPGQAEGEHETAHPKLEIEYNFTPGAPECRYQSNGDPGWPADPDEVALISAKLIDGDGLNPTQEQINEWAEHWLEDAGYDHACLNAQADREPDPDEAYERMRDDREDELHWGDDE